MRLFSISFFLLLSFGVSNNATSYTPVLTLPEGTPATVEGYDTRSLFDSYLFDVEKNIKESAQRALERIDIQPLKYKGANRVQRHGVNFRYYQSNGKNLGQAFYSCDRNKNCDWVLKIVRVPYIDGLDWAYKHFDAEVAVKSLIARDIKPEDSYSQLGFLLGLEKPADKIFEGAMKQLYFGSECSAITTVLGVDKFGHDRVRYLLDLVEGKNGADTPSISTALFDFEIASESEPLEKYGFSQDIKISFAGDYGNRLAENLIRETSNCENKVES